jgi:predicted nuclease of restriction endonuclease-like (RecB) superfamily
MIQEARQEVARRVDSTLVILYWNIGQRIRQDILKEKRAAYGQEIVYAVSRQLAAEFGSGYSRANLFNMIRFAEAFPQQKIVSLLSRYLSWTHFRHIIYLDDPLKRDFYAEMCRVERWNTRTLAKKISGMLFERTALSKKPKKLIEQEIKALREEDRLSPDLVFKDPYFLEFLGLKDRYLEKDIEDAIMRQMEHFILELGVGFSFVARQKRISLDDVDYYLDLLFYHRRLHRLVAIELKMEKFRAEHKGQMELYLRWLDRYERQADEESPIGLILCAGKSERHVELLELNKGGIRVAAYMTELPPRDVLEKKLLEAIKIARSRMERKTLNMPQGAGANAKKRYRLRQRPT